MALKPKVLLNAMAPQAQNITYYERLGVSRSADADSLRQAFRRLSKAVHPDTTRLPAQDAARQLLWCRNTSCRCCAGAERLCFTAGAGTMRMK